MRTAIAALIGLSFLPIACERSESVKAAPEPSTSEVVATKTANPPPTDIFEWTSGGLMTLAVDMNENGSDEWIVATSTELRVVDFDGVVIASAPLSGGIQVLSSARMDEANVLLVGSGLTVKRREGRGRISLFRLQGGELIEEVIFEMDPSSPRHEIVALQQRQSGRLLLAYFKSRFLVEAHTAQRKDQGWELEPIGTFRMATAWGLGDVDGDGQEDIVVGRIYGDEGVEDGDAFWLKPDGTRVAIPTTRGVRSLHLADLDSDGRAEVYLGDGWHQHYKAQGQALLTQAKFTNGSFETRPVVEFPDELEYIVWEIFSTRLNPQALYARTDVALYQLKPDGAFESIAAAVQDGAVNRNGEILVLGPVPQILNPAN